MTWSILFYSLFSGACWFATEPWHLGLFRSLAALGMGGEWSLGVALVMEIWPANKRPLMAGLIGASANLGYCVIALIKIGFEIGNWRTIMIIGALPAVLTFLIRLFVPESEKWQESVAKEKATPLRDIFSRSLIKNTMLAIGSCWWSLGGPCNGFHSGQANSRGRRISMLGPGVSCGLLWALPLAASLRQ